MNHDRAIAKEATAVWIGAQIEIEKSGLETVGVGGVGDGTVFAAKIAWLASLRNSIVTRRSVWATVRTQVTTRRGTISI